MPTNWEDIEQEALFQWADVHAPRYPLLNLMYAIPNGGKRTPKTAATLKRTGVKAGVPDVFLPVPRGLYHGLYIELKAIYPDGTRGRLSPLQKAWAQALKNVGYQAVSCWGHEAAERAIMDYLGVEL